VRRATYRQAHPTEIAAFKCMDGRLDLARITMTPPGVIRTFQSVGGDFDFGWPLLGRAVRKWFDVTIALGRNCLIIVTYHFSKSNAHWGCEEMEFNTAKALAAARKLSRQVEDIFGSSVRTTHPVVVGIETDDDALVMHSEYDIGVTYDVAEHLDKTENEISREMRHLYPSMLQRTLDDLIALVAGNQIHVRETRTGGRNPIALDQTERVIAVGSGFDWLHMPNTALIIGTYDHKWPDAVVSAGNRFLNNIDSRRIPVEEGVLVLVAALSQDPIGSFGWNFCNQETQYLEDITLATLTNHVPDLMPYVRHRRGVLEEDTRFLHLSE
jgi:hypothetical protein